MIAPLLPLCQPTFTRYVPPEKYLLYKNWSANVSEPNLSALNRVDVTFPVSVGTVPFTVSKSSSAAQIFTSSPLPLPDISSNLKALKITRKSVAIPFVPLTITFTVVFPPSRNAYLVS